MTTLFLGNWSSYTESAISLHWFPIIMAVDWYTHNQECECVFNVDALLCTQCLVTYTQAEKKEGLNKKWSYSAQAITHFNITVISQLIYLFFAPSLSPIDRLYCLRYAIILQPD